MGYEIGQIVERSDPKDWGEVRGGDRAVLVSRLIGGDWTVRNFRVSKNQGWNECNFRLIEPAPAELTPPSSAACGTCLILEQEANGSLERIEKLETRNRELENEIRRCDSARADAFSQRDRQREEIMELSLRVAWLERENVRLAGKAKGAR